MRTIILILVSLTTLSLKSQADKKFSGYYFAFWGRTTWEYKFFENNTYWFRSTGHFGNTRSSGNYTIKDDIICLNSIPTDTIEKDSFLNFKNHTFKIDGDSCIINLSSYQDYCKNNWVTNQFGQSMKTSRDRTKKVDTNK